MGLNETYTSAMKAAQGLRGKVSGGGMRVVGIVVLAVVAFLAGYWPMRGSLSATRAEVAQLQGQCAAAQEQQRTEVARLEEELAAKNERERLSDLLGQALRLSELVAARNFGEAKQASTEFFDRVRAESARSSRDDVKGALQQVLQARDQVTSGVATADAGLMTLVRTLERTLRQSLGYPLG